MTFVFLRVLWFLRLPSPCLLCSLLLLSLRPQSCVIFGLSLALFLITVLVAAVAFVVVVVEVVVLVVAKVLVIIFGRRL